MVGSSRLRILGYVAILAIHISNLKYMETVVKGHIGTKDQRLLAYKGLSRRFFTVWNLILQLSYIILGLLIDISNIFITKNKNVLLKYVDEFREVMLASLVWPSALAVSTLFWSVYNYDRSLIFPELLDQILPTISNHVIHTFIVPVVLFEAVSRPRTEPDTHKWNVLLLTVYTLVYLLVLIFTLKEKGVPLYPIFAQLYESAYFPLFVVIMYSMFLIIYYLQWPLTKMIHGKEVTRRNEKKKL